MGRKTVVINSINGGISNNSTYIEPSKVVDIENIDMYSEEDGIILAKTENTFYINNRGQKGTFIGKINDQLLTRDGYFENKYKNEYSDPSSFNYAYFQFPGIITEYIGGDYNGYMETNGNEQKYDIRNVLGYSNTGKKGQKNNFYFMADHDKLHIIKDGVGLNYVNTRKHANIQEGDIAASGWEWTGNSYQHTLGNTNSFRYDLNQYDLGNFEGYIIKVGIKNCTQGTLEVTHYSNYIKKTWNGSERVEEENAKNNKHYIDKEYNNRIFSLSVDGKEKTDSVGIIFTPSNDFDGEVYMLGIYIIKNSTNQHPLNFGKKGGIRTNYHRLKASKHHPMIILGNILYIGCADQIQVYLIEQGKEGIALENGNIQLIENNTISLGSQYEVIGITQYGNGLMYYVNGKDNCYQIYSTQGGAIGDRIIWKNAQFISIHNDGIQDYIIIDTMGVRAMHIFSGGNRKEIYNMKYIPELERNRLNLIIRDREIEDYNFYFTGKNLIDSDRQIFSSGFNHVYIMENGRMGKYSIGLYAETKYIERKEYNTYNIYHIIKKKGEDADKGINALKTIILGNNSGQTYKEGYVVLPPIVRNYDGGSLVEIEFGAYLPNKENKIEIWAKSDYRRFFTIYYSGSKINFGNCTLGKGDKKNKIQEISSGQDQYGNNYCSFMLSGEIHNFGVNVSIYKDGNKMLDDEKIIYYDNYIKIEDVTRENQSGGKDYGLYPKISLKKINKYIGDFKKLYLKLKIVCINTSYEESIKIFTPLYIYYE